MTPWTLSFMMLRGVELSSDLIENHLIEWVELACKQIANGCLSNYFRCELNVPKHVFACRHKSTHERGHG